MFLFFLSSQVYYGEFLLAQWVLDRAPWNAYHSGLAFLNKDTGEKCPALSDREAMRSHAKPAGWGSKVRQTGTWEADGLVLGFAVDGLGSLRCLQGTSCRFCLSDTDVCSWHLLSEDQLVNTGKCANQEVLNDIGCSMRCRGQSLAYRPWYHCLSCGADFEA